MVGLLPDRPQRGQSRITNLKSLAANFETWFELHCRNVDHGRDTGEKALQSFLVANAQRSGRGLYLIMARANLLE